MQSNYHGYDLSQDHPGYSLPLSNISYHVYPEKTSTQDASVSQKAFRRIMDSYDEYEKLADLFQVELDKRQQLVNERKAREKLLREERSRQLREERRGRRVIKSKAATPSDSSAAVSASDACLPLSASSTPFSSISLFAPLPYSGGQEQTTHWMRKKRKQAIPVHSSVVDRTPGITLRIQPDTTSDQHLQVEILKNVEDYRPTQAIREGEGEGEGEVDAVVVLDEDEDMDRITQQVHTEDKIQAKQDLDKIIQSIKSGRPGYAFYPSSVAGGSAAYQHLHMSLNEDSHGHGKSTSLLDQNTHVSKKSLSTFETSVIMIPSMDLEDVIAARAALPLSWNNFSTRDCQVNKVIGRHDRDFELLEEVVQEAVARQHAAHVLPSSDESDSHKSNQSPVKTQNRRVSHPPHERELEKEREDSAAVASSVSTPLTASPTKKARSRTHSRKLSESVPPSVPATPTKARSTGARATRGGDSRLVQGYDDIEKILKEKRQKKRAEKQRQESVGRMTSEPVTDGDHETDVDIEGHEELETITMKSEDDIVLSLSHSHSQRESSPLLTNPVNNNNKMEEALKYKDGVSRPYSQSNSPPSPPHSRQTSPVRGVSGNTYTNAAPESDTSSTPPTTPLFAPKSTDNDHLSANTHEQQQQQQQQQLESSASIIATSTPATTLPSGGVRARTRVRSDSNPIPPEGKNSFFDSALEQIAAKRRKQLAKKKAAAAAATATDDTANIPPPTTPPRNQDQDAHEELGNPLSLAESADKNDGDGKETLEQLLEDSEMVIELDSHALERGLHGQESDKGVQSSAANLPKSSKYLPGRVLRKTRSKMQDHFYVTGQTTTSSTNGTTTTTTTVANAGSIEQHSHDAVEDIDLLDPDCTSCRLVLNSFDRLLWKQAREAGKVHLNRRTWSKTAILCIACRLQYQKHHLRCTQCFYVPVLTDDMMMGRGGLKAGGTCSRCKAGTWHRDSD
ncbi:hypothetical protein BGX26_000626 [Mortierella sp. AD094]|nr:hypothetical protein BGX26_000626 [Mortierella sp. AD094]